MCCFFAEFEVNHWAYISLENSCSSSTEYFSYSGLVPVFDKSPDTCVDSFSITNGTWRLQWKLPGLTRIQQIAISYRNISSCTNENMPLIAVPQNHSSCNSNVDCNNTALYPQAMAIQNECIYEPSNVAVMTDKIEVSFTGWVTICEFSYI